MPTEDNPNTFRIGDTVRISNIPGPRMVVTAIEPDQKGIASSKPAQVQCMWFDRRAELRSRAFEPRFLSKASPWADRPRTSSDPSYDPNVTMMEHADAAD
jgi:uncharacterized protein YodC (DUF2158 family)